MLFLFSAWGIIVRRGFTSEPYITFVIDLSIIRYRIIVPKKKRLPRPEEGGRWSAVAPVFGPKPEIIKRILFNAKDYVT